MAPRDGELAARLRAAQAYSGLENGELARRLSVSVETLSRMKNSKTTIAADIPERWAEATGVPRQFMEVGFGPLERPISDVHLLIQGLEGQLRELGDAVAGLSVDSARHTQELRELRGEGRQPGRQAGDR